MLFDEQYEAKKTVLDFIDIKKEGFAKKSYTAI